jgi:hypothetical protein
VAKRELPTQVIVKQRELAEQRAEMDELDDRLGALTARRADLDARLEALDALRAERDALRAERDALRAERDALRAEMETLPDLATRRAELADLDALDALDSRWTELRAERAAQRAELDDRLDALEARRAELGARWLELDALAMRRAERDGSAARWRAEAAESSTEGENVGLCAAQVASRASRVWSRFGLILPSRTRERVFDPDLAEHTADLYEALAMAGSRGKQNWLVLSFTIAAIGKALACAGVAFRRRLLDEFIGLMGLTSRRGWESPPSTPRDSD